ncbi:conserved hypothetical protein [Citreicella sp. SE45]|nr:conserved hypothetical protein [Citreicella sp. SE45]
MSVGRILACVCGAELCGHCGADPCRLLGAERCSLSVSERRRAWGPNVAASPGQSLALCPGQSFAALRGGALLRRQTRASPCFHPGAMSCDWVGAGPHLYIGAMSGLRGAARSPLRIKGGVAPVSHAVPCPFAGRVTRHRPPSVPDGQSRQTPLSSPGAIFRRPLAYYRSLAGGEFQYRTSRGLSRHPAGRLPTHLAHFPLRPPAITRRPSLRT